MQTTDNVLMVRPVHFAFNEETASNNAFQQKSRSDVEAMAVQQQAVAEFDAYVELLRENGVHVEVLQDTPDPFTPDSIFPNNCFSTHCDANRRTLVLYPMFAPNRRLERTKIQHFLDSMTFDRIVDLTAWEQQGRYLEGTGALVLDREHRIAYACRSPRTDEAVLKDWATQLGYDYFLFDSVDETGMPVYHTNVIMHVGTRFAIVCLDSVLNLHQRENLLAHLTRSNKEVIAISFDQMHHFSGNMLELRNARGEKLLVMSATAKAALASAQLALLKQDVRILAPDIHSIETAGGGSARCMIAELFS